MFLKIWQISQENACVGVNFIIDKTCFRMKIAKFLGTPFFHRTSLVAFICCVLICVFNRSRKIYMPTSGQIFIRELFCTSFAFGARKLRIWSHLVKKSLMENFIFCASYVRLKYNLIFEIVCYNL